jgi:glycosyltransferase involved in cell wall biosynthesis
LEGGPLKVLLVLPSLGGGGAERTFVNLANRLDRDRFAPAFALVRREGAYLGALRGDVTVFDLAKRRPHHAILTLARLFRRESPDVILATVPRMSLATFFAWRLSRVRSACLVRESMHVTTEGLPVGSLPSRLIGCAYRNATALLCLSRGVADDCAWRYGIPRERIAVIYNPIEIAAIRAQAREPLSDRSPLGDPNDKRFRIVAAGRLVPQKGFDLLLGALADLREVDWHLTLLGEGPERGALEELVRRLGIASRVRFEGFQSNPYAYMARADLFVLSSRWEGFGHVVAEAMASGVPVLATRCPSGPDEIVTDGEDGRLCAPDSARALLDALRELSADEPLRKRLVARAAATVERFDAAAIVKQYESLFLEHARRTH